MPDFDLDAVSSVLYYIYHGEVVIQRCQLNEFLDIIRNLEIYIDPQYFKISNGMEHLDNGEYQENNLSKNDETFANSEREYVNKKKGIKNIICNVQCSFDGLDFGDKEIRTRSENFSSSAGDVVRCEDRQRGSLLRDLFIETYAQNGCSNGLGAGVLAISNEHYREPRSVVFTNANAAHPNTLAETHKIVSELRSYILPTSQKPLSSHKNCQAFNNCTTESFAKLTEMHRSKSGEKKVNENGSLPLNFKNSCLIRSESSTLDLRMSVFKNDDVECIFKRKNFNESSSIKLCNEEIHTKVGVNHKDNNSKGIETREVILNEVLENPWSPRLPYYYKPFRRKTAETVPVNSIKVSFDLGAIF